MTKQDIVNQISKKTGIDKVTALAVVEAFMEQVKDSLGANENVYLRGFGSFILKKRAQKTARNITQNTTMIIPEHNIPAFKPARPAFATSAEVSASSFAIACAFSAASFSFSLVSSSTKDLAAPEHFSQLPEAFLLAMAA